ncbi:hypothetical protein ONS96_008041 [Cadophora gregata f. sp. sojae]|nr:hypothetical protein ONS96_008041 [Cadophora gregata f. sp. sojae]
MFFCLYIIKTQTLPKSHGLFQAAPQNPYIPQVKLHTAMTLDRSHVPRLPAFTFCLRYAQLLVAIAVLGLSAYVVTYFAYSGASLSLFTASTSHHPQKATSDLCQAIATITIAVYYIASVTFRPVFFNYWAVIGLDIFGLIFWLTSFALLASEAAAWTVITHFGDNRAYSTTAYCCRKRALAQKRSTDHHTYRNAMAAGAGLGGLEFFIFSTTLGFTAFAVSEHRRRGGHCIPTPEVDLLAAEQRDQETLAPPQHQTQPVSLQSQVRFSNDRIGTNSYV